jgi:type VII secretion protein EccB
VQSRRDQLQAHSYLTGRLASALVRAEPDAPETPLRRTASGWFIGVVISMLVVVGFAIFGLIFPGGNKGWAGGGQLVVEKETGNRYIYVDGRLYPVLNYASAALLLQGLPPVASVSRKSLAGVPHGQPVGIVGAPDALPAPAALIPSGWLVCTTIQADQTGTPVPIVTLQIGGVASAEPLKQDRAVLVVAPDGTEYLAWNGLRLKFSAAWVGSALNLRGVPAVRVGYAWLNTLAAGPDLLAPPVPDRGQPGPVIGGVALRVGQVVLVQTVGAGDSYYLVGPTSLTPLTQTQAALTLGDPSVSQAYPGQAVAPIGLSPGQIAAYVDTSVGANVADGALDAAATMPAVPPKAAAPGSEQALCSVTGNPPSTSRPSLVFAAPPTASAAPAVGPSIARDARVANRIIVAPGAGALVRPLLGAGLTGAAIYLITDLGVKYPIPGDDAAAMLGYDASTATVVPSSLLALLPTGPALDPEVLAG